MLTIKKLETPYEADGTMHWKFKDWKERNGTRFFSISFAERAHLRCPHLIPNFEAQMFFRFGEERYLSNFISKEDINEWDASRPVFISAPTGAGKSHFILHELLEHVVKENWFYGEISKILILSNRIALNRQLKLAVAELIRYYISDKEQQDLLEEMLKMPPEEFDQCLFDFGMITVCSYHRMEKDASSLKWYSHIVCDECHFFTSDSMFNEYTGRVMKRIVHEGQNAIRIYMSATPEVVFEPILRAEYCRLAGDNAQDCSLDLYFYYLARDYSYLKDIYHYRCNSELLDAIRQFDEKWLVFVDSCKRGEQLKAALEKDRKCVFISTDSKSQGNAKRIFDGLVETESLGNHVDVLICTAVLDNGVNIKDFSVKNIAIEVFDRVEFLQMLGRVRRIDGHNLRLFVRESDPVRLAGWLDKNMLDLSEKILDEIDGYGRKYEIAKNGFIYTGLNREMNQNRIYHQLDAIHRLRRFLSLSKTSPRREESSPNPNPDYAAIYRYFSADDKETLGHPLREDMLHIFSPPNPWDGKLKYGDSEPVPSFLKDVYGILIPETVGCNMDKAQRHRIFADDSLYRTSLEETLRWIEKNLADCSPVSTVLHQTEEPRYDTFFLKFVVTLAEYTEWKANPYRNILSVHGLEKGSSDYKTFLQLYTPESGDLRAGMIVLVRSVGKFRLASLRTPDAKRTTFYFLLQEPEK